MLVIQFNTNKFMLVTSISYSYRNDIPIPMQLWDINEMNSIFFGYVLSHDNFEFDPSDILSSVDRDTGLLLRDDQCTLSRRTMLNVTQIALIAVDILRNGYITFRTGMKKLYWIQRLQYRHQESSIYLSLSDATDELFTELFPGVRKSYFYMGREKFLNFSIRNFPLFSADSIDLFQRYAKVRSDIATEISQSLQLSASKEKSCKSTVFNVSENSWNLLRKDFEDYANERDIPMPAYSIKRVAKRLRGVVSNCGIREQDISKMIEKLVIADVRYLQDILGSYWFWAAAKGQRDHSCIENKIVNEISSCCANARIEFEYSIYSDTLQIWFR